MGALALDIHQEIIEKCKEGNQRAFKQLYELYSKAMYNVALRIVKEQDEAADVLQEAFVKAYGKINQFQYEATFGAWLKRIVINQALDSIRKRKGEVVFPEEMPEPVEEEAVDWDSVNLSVARVKQAVAKLPEGFRVVFSLHLFEGYEHKEIADILNISEGTSKSQFHRAKRKVKDLMFELK